MLKDLSKKLAGLGMREEFSHKAGLHSDHQPFMLAGVPVVGLMAKLEGEGAYYYHSVGDTFEKVSQSGLCRAAAVGAHTLWALADAPERLFPTMSPTEVRKMIDEADLYEALQAEDYDGPPMHVNPRDRLKSARLERNGSFHTVSLPSLGTLLYSTSVVISRIKEHDPDG